MQRLCSNQIKKLANLYNSLLISVLINSCFGINLIQLDRSLTNAHQNGPIFLPEFDPPLGLVYDSDDSIQNDHYSSDDDLVRNKIVPKVKMSAKASKNKESTKVKRNYISKLQYYDDDNLKNDFGTKINSRKEDFIEIRKPDYTMKKDKIKGEEKHEVDEEEEEEEKKKENVNNTNGDDDDYADEKRERLDLIKKLKPLLAKFRDLSIRRNKGKHKMKTFFEKGHEKHGWRNYYHKEEIGKSKRHSLANDKNWKSKFSSYKANPIKSVSATFNGEKSSVVYGKRGSKSSIAKSVNGSWKPQFSTKYDKGNGVELASRKAKITINGKDVLNTVNNINNNNNNQNSTTLAVIAKIEEPKARRIVTSNNANRNELLRINSMKSKDDHQAITKDIMIKPKFKNTRFDDDSHLSVPTSWILPAPFLEARSRVIKAFLKGDI